MSGGFGTNFHVEGAFASLESRTRTCANDEGGHGNAGVTNALKPRFANVCGVTTGRTLRLATDRLHRSVQGFPACRGAWFMLAVPAPIGGADRSVSAVGPEFSLTIPQLGPALGWC